MHLQHHQSPHPGPMTPHLAATAGLLAMAPALSFGWHNMPTLLAGGLENPDSAMRLVRLHDIIAAGQPLHAVMRDGSGAGTVLHWSHLLDSLLLLLGAPLAPLLGWDAALHLVALLFGPLCMAGLGITAVWASLPLAGRGWAWLAAPAAGSTPVLMSYGMPGVVHHHVLLAVVATAACGWALRLVRGAAPGSASITPDAAGIALGAWAGAGLWLSPESLPFTLMAIGGVWVAWFAAPGPRLARALATSGTTFFLVVAAAWLADPPAPPFAHGLAAIEPDRISLPFVLLAAAAMLTALAAQARAARIFVLSFGVTLACWWLALFPQMLDGTEALMPPEAAAAFFGNIVEMKPVQNAPAVFEHLTGALFSLIVLLTLAWRRPMPERLFALTCAAVLTALAALHVRFAAYPCVAGAVLLPAVLAWISAGAVRLSWQPIARMALVVPLLTGPFLAPLAATPALAATTTQCPIAGAITLLQPYPDATVLADVNDTPDILYQTQVRTVGSLYHRNPAAFMRLRAAWRSIPGDLPSPELRATRATLILACPGAPRSSILAGTPHNTLLDRVDDNHPPTWLHRLADAGPGNFVLYAVAPQPTP